MHQRAHLEQLGGILLQSAIAQLHKSELQLHHRKHVFHLRAHRRLRAVLRPLHFVNTILVAVAPMGAVPSLRRALPDHFRLSAIRLIAPHSRFFAVQQIGQHRRIGYVGRRRHRRVDDLRLAIYSHVRLHPEVPLFALLRLVHLRIALLLPVLGRSGCLQDGRVHDRARRDSHPLRLQVQVHLPQDLFPQLVFFQQVPELAHRGFVRHRLEDLVPSMQSILDRLVAPLPTGRAVIYISERWRAVLPSVQRGFSPEFLQKIASSGAGEYISELAYRRGGFVSFRELSELPEPLPAFPGARFEQFRQVLGAERIRNITAVSLQTREHNFGVILFPHAARRALGSSNLRLLIGLALQIGLTLENYVVMHDTQRRTKEFELLTQIGQAISSRLDQDEVLRAIQKELGQIFDTSEFYIAFQEGDEIRFELEVVNGEVQPKRSRKAGNGLTDYIIRAGQPLLVRAELEKARERLGVTFVPGKPAKCFCAVPILLGGKPAGVMAAMNTEREYVFEQRDLEVMQIAGGQLSVAVENARLFAEEQRRARQFAFLNSISKTAISSEDSEQMLAEIVSHIQKNFRFDHIGIGIFDYFTKEIEIRAEAGITAQVLGKRIPLGTGIVGRVARTGETALVQMTGDQRLQGVLPDSHAVLCIPITYGEKLQGVLNVESQSEDAFTPQDVLVMKTLADLLATALHNALVFQQLQQQSITDGLTGIKTRRFFWEALNSEWKRASRSGRPFSVVLMDLDKFKEVNDTKGHLEGDLVLARVGRLLEQKCRQSNVVARYGGDEFIILMPETGVEQAQILAERLRLWISTDPMLQEQHITC